MQRRKIQPQSPLESLSPREREILQLVVEGKTSPAIAEILFISPKTVETYRSRLMHKLGLKDTAGLVKFAIAQGLTGVD
jgi:DNA-binding CsgD family transcriptional regulator